MKNKILLSIVTPTLNNSKDINTFLNSIKKQRFPKSKLEIVISDGGSIDNTTIIAKKMGARVIKNRYIFADPGVSLGIKNAKGEIIMVMACDNIYEDKNAFRKIVKVFENEEIMAAFPLHFSSKKDSLFTKYINTFTDPFNHFVQGYASNGRTFNKIYKTLEKNKIYDIYDYSSYKDLPLIAIAQGFTVRKGFKKSKNSAFDDIMPVIELINQKDKIAFVHSVKMYHHTVKNLRHFIKKQIWETVNALRKKNYGIAHRINYLSDDERFRIKIWPFYALSFIFPLVRSLYYLIKDREPLWIFHSFLCMISALSSIAAAFIYFTNKKYEFTR